MKKIIKTRNLKRLINKIKWIILVFKSSLLMNKAQILNQIIKISLLIIFKLLIKKINCLMLLKKIKIKQMNL